MRAGVNYTPSDGWFHSWFDLDLDRVARDLDQVASLGVDHVRIFPLWPIVQPNRTLIRQRALEDVVAVVDVAARAGLDVNVDAVQGHLSSFDFVPSWLESWHRRNLFTDPDVVGSTADYVHALAAAVGGRSNLVGVTVGNELNQFAGPPHPAPHTVDPAGASRWLEAMTSAARSGLRQGRGPSDGVVPWVTHAMYDAAWYDDRQPFGPAHAADHGDATVTHSWVFNGSAQLAGPLGPGSVRHGEYLLQLAAAWNADPARANWLQEVGSPTNVVPASDGPDFVEATLRHAADVQHLWGITWWCSHDVSRSLADFPDLEHDLGLFTAGGELKPTGRRFAEVVAELRDRPAAAPAPDALVLDDVDGEGRPTPDHRGSCAPGGAFARSWLRVAERTGRGPQVVLASRLDDPAHLPARGVRTLHRVDDDATMGVVAAHPATMP
jgi:hypothetical protein